MVYSTRRTHHSDPGSAVCSRRLKLKIMQRRAAGDGMTTSMWRPITAGSIKCVNALIFSSFLRLARPSPAITCTAFVMSCSPPTMLMLCADRHFVARTAEHVRVTQSTVSLALRYSVPFIETLFLMTRRQTLILHFYLMHSAARALASMRNKVIKTMKLSHYSLSIHCHIKFMWKKCAICDKVL